MPIMVLPLLSTIIAGLLMMTFIGQPIVWLQKTLIHLLESMGRLKVRDGRHPRRDGHLRLWRADQ